MKTKLHLCLLLTITTASSAFGVSLELLNPSNVRYSFEVKEGSCVHLQVMRSQKLALSKQLDTIALSGNEILQAEPLASSDSIEKATEGLRELQKTTSSITSEMRDLSQKITEESNTRGGLRHVDYVSIQVIPQQSEIFYTDVSSFPTVPLQNQPSFLGYRTDVVASVATVTSILSKGYA